MNSSNRSSSLSNFLRMFQFVTVLCWLITLIVFPLPDWVKWTGTTLLFCSTIFTAIVFPSSPTTEKFSERFSKRQIYILAISFAVGIGLLSLISAAVSYLVGSVGNSQVTQPETLSLPLSVESVAGILAALQSVVFLIVSVIFIDLTVAIVKTSLYSKLTKPLLFWLGSILLFSGAIFYALEYSTDTIADLAVLGGLLVANLMLLYLIKKVAKSELPYAVGVTILPDWKRYYVSYYQNMAALFAMVFGANLLTMPYALTPVDSMFLGIAIIALMLAIWILVVKIKLVRKDDPNNNRYVFLTRYRFSNYQDLDDIKRIGEFSLWEINKIDVLKELAQEEDWLARRNLRRLCWYLYLEGGDGGKDETTLPYDLSGLEVKRTNPFLA